MNKAHFNFSSAVYDKRNDFNFYITNFPFMGSNIPSSLDYGVFISKHLYDMHGLALHMNGLFLRQFELSIRYWNRNASSLLRKFNATRILINVQCPSGKCLMTFSSSTSNSHFLTDQTLHQCSDLDTEFDSYRTTERHPWSSCNGCGITAKNAYPSVYLVRHCCHCCSLVYALIVETIFLNLSWF